jgi:dolichyl-phosphate-mannose-protein mannosyltransferase
LGGWVPLALVGAIALALRLAGLGYPQAIVFDETYYVPFALDYLRGTPSFDAHPPLGKYLIALGLWLGQFPASGLGWPRVAVANGFVSPLAYRWLNAVVGATIPLLLAALAYQVSGGFPTQRRRTFARLAALLMALEGLTLVESRLALINIYGLALGLLGQWAWLRAGASPHPSRWRWIAGIALGAAINVKWNWAGLWLGLVLWEGFTGSLHPKSLSPGERDFEECSRPPSFPGRRAWGLRVNPWGDRMLYLALLPLVTYLLLWLPHLALAGQSLGAVHRQIWVVHQAIAHTADHPYCSPWYSWPLLGRPMAYFYDRQGQGTAAIATTIHAIGNPVLWWLSTAAVVGMALGGLARWRAIAHPPAPRAVNHAVVPFILLNYLANWLPWALVSRCTFFYHALGIAIFGPLALAWLMARWMDNPRQRPIALGLLGAIGISFLFWLPLYLGLPLSPEALQRRWLLPGWI